MISKVIILIIWLYIFYIILKTLVYIIFLFFTFQ